MSKKFISLPSMDLMSPGPFRTEAMIGDRADLVQSIFSPPLEIEFRTRDPEYRRLELGQILREQNGKFYKIINTRVSMDYDGDEMWAYKLREVSKFDIRSMEEIDENILGMDFEGFRYSDVMERVVKQSALVSMNFDEMQKLASQLGMEDSPEEEQEEVFEVQEGQTILLLKIDTDDPEDEEETQIDNLYAMEIDLED